MVFVDTGAWFAQFVPGDPDHARVMSWIDANNEPLLTTDYCVDEALTLLVARRRLPRALQLGRAVFQRSAVNLHYVSPQQIHRAWILFQQRAAAGWSFTDCTSKIVIDDLEIKTAVALDDHFRQFGDVTIVP
jgi:predicted nucleic acid-binding protein